MKRNRESKARIRVIAYFGLNKELQRLLDQKVQRHGARYSDIYRDLKIRIKKWEPDAITHMTVLYLGEQVTKGFLIDFVRKVVPAPYPARLTKPQKELIHVRKEGTKRETD